MKQRSSVCLMKWLALMLVSLLPLSGIAVEPVKGVQIPSATDLTLPIHQKPKLHPELSDPVLGDQAQIVEWAWSPQYAKRFNLPVQPDGLKDGGLWLVGVKIARKQYQQWQTYTCSIVGVMDNTLQILTPPGEVYIVHPDSPRLGGLPGKQTGKGITEGGEYAPGQSAKHKFPRSEAERTKGYGITTPYIYFYRNFQPGLAYFELSGGCSYFRDPDQFFNELRFPTQAVGKKDDAVFESSAVKFDLSDSLMRRIYPYALDADDWTSCLMRRIGGKTHPLSLRATKFKRFGNTCEPVTQPAK